MTPIGQDRWRNSERENIFVWQTEPVSGLTAWRPGSFSHRTLDLVAEAPDADASRATLSLALPAPVMGASLLFAREAFSSGVPVAQRARNSSLFMRRDLFSLESHPPGSPHQWRGPTSRVLPLPPPSSSALGLTCRTPADGVWRPFSWRLRGVPAATGGFNSPSPPLMPIQPAHTGWSPSRWTRRPTAPRQSRLTRPSTCDRPMWWCWRVVATAAGAFGAKPTAEDHTDVDNEEAASDGGVSAPSAATALVWSADTSADGCLSAPPAVPDTALAGVTRCTGPPPPP